MKKCAVHKSYDSNTYGLDVVLRPIVEELQLLEKEGIPVHTSTFQGVVKFSVVQVVGDNLGLNAILGYSESFTANHGAEFINMSRHSRHWRIRHNCVTYTPIRQIYNLQAFQTQG